MNRIHRFALCAIILTLGITISGFAQTEPQVISGNVKGYLRDASITMDPDNGNIVIVFNQSNSRKQEFGKIYLLEGILQEDGSYQFGPLVKVSEGGGSHQRPSVIFIPDIVMFVLMWDTGPRDPFNESWIFRTSSLLLRMYKPSWANVNSSPAGGELLKLYTILEGRERLELHPVMVYTGISEGQESVMWRFTSIEKPASTATDSSGQSPNNGSGIYTWVTVWENGRITICPYYKFPQLRFVNQIKKGPYWTTDGYYYNGWQSWTAFYIDAPTRWQSVYQVGNSTQMGKINSLAPPVSPVTTYAQYTSFFRQKPIAYGYYPQGAPPRFIYLYPTGKQGQAPNNCAGSFSEGFDAVELDTAIDPRSPCFGATANQDFYFYGRYQPPVKKDMTMTYHATNGWFKHYNFGINFKSEKIVSSKKNKLWKIKKKRFAGMDAEIFNKNAAVVWEEYLNKKGTKVAIKFGTYKTK